MVDAGTEMMRITKGWSQRLQMHRKTENQSIAAMAATIVVIKLLPGVTFFGRTELSTRAFLCGLFKLF